MQSFSKKGKICEDFTSSTSNQTLSILYFSMDAEIVVSTLIAKLQNEIPGSIYKQQVKKAIKDLHLVKKYLKVADNLEASSDDHLIKLLKAVYSAEDAADTLIVTRGEFQTQRKSGLQKLVPWPSITNLCSHILISHQINKFKNEMIRNLSTPHQLLELKKAVTGDIKDTSLSSQNDSKGQQSQPQQRYGRISDFWLEETDVVRDLKEQVDEVIKNLKYEPHNVESSHVIAVVGERGSGKTTFVKSVCKKRIATIRLPIVHAWVRVPSLFRAKYVLADILRQIKQTDFAFDRTAPDEKFIVEITESLRGKNYLLVIEDVESPKIWEALHQGLISALRKSGNGVIIVTTPNEDVVSQGGTDSIIKVRQLDNECRWELFLKKVKIVDDDVSFKEQILKVCGGSPLRIVLLAALLKTKGPEEWSGVIERANNIGGDILSLSYQDLPSQVKPCFLYLGLFPRGFEIPVRRLIHLWVSEGFVTVPLDPEVEMTPEDLADMYFEELIVRNMIQVTWRLDGSPETCCMPTSLYEIFSPKAENSGFFYHQFKLSHDQQPQFTLRRLAACLGIEVFRSSFIHVKHLRSFVAFDTRISGMRSGEIDKFLNKITTKMNFGLLKVLDLEGVYRPILSEDAIGKLLLLSYLGLRSTLIDFLPSSVGNLPYLETLDVKHTRLNVLPSSTWQAKKLRHLYLNWSSCPSNVNNLLSSSSPPTNLHTLWGISISDDGIASFQMLTGLRKLGLTCTSTNVAKATSQWLSQLTNLHSLKLRSKLSDEILIELPTMGTYHKLRELYLKGKLSKRSLIDVEFPPNLRILTLSGSGLDDDPMPVLGRLPQLQTLRLFSNSYAGEKMTCPDGRFAKLLALKLWKLEWLREWRVEKGGMPCLRELEITSCEELFFIPGFELLDNLTKVTIAKGN